MLTALTITERSSGGDPRGQEEPREAADERGDEPGRQGDDQRQQDERPCLYRPLVEPRGLLPRAGEGGTHIASCLETVDHRDRALQAGRKFARPAPVFLEVRGPVEEDDAVANRHLGLFEPAGRPEDPLDVRCERGVCRGVFRNGRAGDLAGRDRQFLDAPCSRASDREQARCQPDGDRETSHAAGLRSPCRVESRIKEGHGDGTPLDVRRSAPSSRRRRGCDRSRRDGRLRLDIPPAASN
jgi:hypothetical protein